MCLPTAAPAPSWSNSQLIDSLVHDGLWDAFNDYHMGVTAENLARIWHQSRAAGRLGAQLTA